MNGCIMYCYWCVQFLLPKKYQEKKKKRGRCFKTDVGISVAYLYNFLLPLSLLKRKLLKQSNLARVMTQKTNKKQKQKEELAKLLVILKCIPSRSYIVTIAVGYLQNIFKVKITKQYTIL